MKLKRWLFPVISAVITSIIILLVYAAAEPYSHDSGYGGLVIGLIGLTFCFAIAVPVLSVLYSKICLHDNENKFLFTIYHSFLIVLPYLILFFREDETIIYAAIIFAWCELWGLIGLIRKKSPEDEETN